MSGLCGADAAGQGLLSFVGEATDPVARLPTGLVSRARFVAQVHALARLLPDHPYMVNFCTDRFAFAVGWAVAMLRRKIMLLPPNRDAAAVDALRSDYPDLFVLGDNQASAAMAPEYFAFPRLDAAERPGIDLAFPPDQIAAVLFTSGSTGKPQPSIRRWGRLVASSLAAGAALKIEDLRGAALIATVPHGHSYGLESAVVLPLQTGLLLTPDRPFFPADVGDALAGEQQPAMLVTTPVHLQALTQDADSDRRPPRIRAGLVLSATAPLSDAIAAAAETLFDAPVCEIYGCSEAGQLATRRTLDGPVWRCMDGFRLYHAASGCWAAGPHEPDVLLADRIELHGDGFVLKGRNADLVNVAGKRSSLAYLTGELTAIEGVRDGVFLNPETDITNIAGPGGSVAGGEQPGSGIPKGNMPSGEVTGFAQRLVALAVAPGLDAETIIARLRQRIDPAFLPRPLCLLDSLPRNALGKLSRTEMLQLVARHAAKTSEPLRLHFAADLPAARGHFPGFPIVPGAVLLDHVVAAIAGAGWSGVIDAAKFHHPVRPGDTIEIVQHDERAATRFECRLAGSRDLVLSGALRSPFPPL